MLLVVSEPRAQTVADFYRGKTLHMVIGYGPGGGYDLYGRLAAEFLGRHIPGNPLIVLKTMLGGSGIKAALLRSERVVIRSRRGGERIQLAANRPRQALKSLLQQADIPMWTRMGLPLVFCGDVLAGVPQIGIDTHFAASAGEDGFELQWDERA